MGLGRDAFVVAVKGPGKVAAYRIIDEIDGGLGEIGAPESGQGESGRSR